MGLTMSPESVTSQLDSMNENLQQAVLNAETMLLNVNDFLDTGDVLKGKSYDNIRNYFGEVHVFVLNAMIKYAENMIQENNTYKGCIFSYLLGVGYVDEDALKKDREFLIGQINNAHNLMTVSKASVSSYISSLEHAKSLVEKKLKQIEDFKGATAGLYQNNESGVSNITNLTITSASVEIASIGEIGSFIRYMGTDPTFELYSKNLEAGKSTLINYLNAHGITNPVEQQVIIYLIEESGRGYWLTSLYITDCKSSADAHKIFTNILGYYEAAINEDANIEKSVNYILTQLGGKENSEIIYNELYPYLECLKKFDFLLQEEIDDLVGKYADCDTITATDFKEIKDYLSDRKDFIDEFPKDRWTRKQIITALAIEYAMQGEYDQDFISGMIGNMMGEGVFGQFENSKYDTNEPYPYIIHINDELNYLEVYSEKNITEFDLMQVYYDLVVRGDECNVEGKAPIHQAGVGIIQWTEPNRFEGLMGYYFRELGYDIESQEFIDMADNYPQYCTTDGYEGFYLTEEQVENAELNWLVDGLKTSDYNEVYSDYQINGITDTTENINDATRRIKELYIQNTNNTLPKRQSYANEWSRIRYGEGGSE